MIDKLILANMLTSSSSSQIYWCLQLSPIDAETAVQECKTCLRTYSLSTREKGQVYFGLVKCSALYKSQNSFKGS